MRVLLSYTIVLYYSDYYYMLKIFCAEIVEIGSWLQYGGNGRAGASYATWPGHSGSGLACRCVSGVGCGSFKDHGYKVFQGNRVQGIEILGFSCLFQALVDRRPRDYSVMIDGLPAPKSSLISKHLCRMVAFKCRVCDTQKHAHLCHFQLPSIPWLMRADAWRLQALQDRGPKELREAIPSMCV